MTNPVILLGTQSNGETLPVQVDATGRLVAEGLQGEKGDPGDPGAPGAPGADGGSFPLPPDPYEGALLGWLEGQLAWIGTPPVPIPEGVFGPITSVDTENGVLEVDGEIPSTVGNGVYIWQVNEDGSKYSTGLDVSREWTNFTTFIDCSNREPNLPRNAFDYHFGTGTKAGATNVPGKMTWPSGSLAGAVRVYTKESGGPGPLTYFDGNTERSVGSPNVDGWNDLGNIDLTQLQFRAPSETNWLIICAIEFEGLVLVDESLSTQMRVNTVMGNTIIGTPLGKQTFEVGKYLRVPSQRVARWVLYGNDPTSRIDLLRNT